MRKLKKYQAQNCSECKRLGNKTPAIWRQDGSWTKAYCDEHKHFARGSRCDNDNYKSEADYEIERRYGI